MGTQEKNMIFEEQLKRSEQKENNASSGDDEEVNVLRSRCSELELELNSKDTQLDAQEVDLRSKEEKIVRLEEIKAKRMKEAKATGDLSSKYRELQKAKDELQRHLDAEKER